VWIGTVFPGACCPSRGCCTVTRRQRHGSVSSVQSLRGYKKRAARELNAFLAVERRTRCTFETKQYPLFRVVGGVLLSGKKSDVLKCRIFAGTSSTRKRLVVTGALAPEKNAMPL